MCTHKDIEPMRTQNTSRVSWRKREIESMKERKKFLSSNKMRNGMYFPMLLHYDNAKTCSFYNFAMFLFWHFKQWSKIGIRQTDNALPLLIMFDAIASRGHSMKFSTFLSRTRCSFLLLSRPVNADAVVTGFEFHSVSTVHISGSQQRNDPTVNNRTTDAMEKSSDTQVQQCPFIGTQTTTCADDDDGKTSMRRVVDIFCHKITYVRTL